MKWVRKFPVFCGALLVVGLTLLAETGLLAGRCRAARVARRQFDQASRDWHALVATQPAPTPENAALIEADLERAMLRLAGLQAELRPAGPGMARLAQPPPVHRPEAFFDIAAFVETMRGRAQQAGVALKPEERFGFASYAHEAPAPGQLAAVYRERLVVQYLMEALLVAQPRRLLSVQRASRPRATGAAQLTPATNGTELGASRVGRPAEAAKLDYFEPDARISARVPGLVETTAFRFVFVGRTAALRALLNKLAEFELPLVVRSVEVASADRPAEESRPSRGATAPLIAAPWSRFTVTVECLSLASSPATNS